jgi:hypothetical protein
MGYTPAVSIGAFKIAGQTSPLYARDSQQEHLLDDD